MLNVFGCEWGWVGSHFLRRQFTHGTELAVTMVPQFHSFAVGLAFALEQGLSIGRFQHVLDIRDVLAFSDRKLLTTITETITPGQGKISTARKSANFDL